MKKIGTAAIATALVLGTGSCTHHKVKPATLPAPVHQPIAQATVLEAPKSLEGAWIKVKSHKKGEPVGAQTDWWYIKDGESHFYLSEECSEGHPITPAYFKEPDYTGRVIPLYEDNLERCYNIGTISYHSRGKTATLRIENYDRRASTLCRSTLISDMADSISDFSEEPAVITFESAGSGVYHGTIKGVFAPGGMPTFWVQKLDTITIYTK